MMTQADCRDWLPTLEGDSCDALVTDPPAGIGFMGKVWDHDKGGRRQWVAWAAEVFSECLRVVKPGGHGFVWALPRTSHWTAWALEDAGWEVRDVVHHIFATGFPKSRNLNGDWQGWGTALKPACENWILARKPLSEKNVAANMTRHGTGAINVDGCRVEYQGDKPTQKEWNRIGSSGVPGGNGFAGQFSKGMKDAYAAGLIPVPSGRWPANLILDEEAGAEMDAWVGERPGPGGFCDTSLPLGGHAWNTMPKRSGQQYPGQTGGPSRFFYCAKASRSEREAGCEGLAEGVLAHGGHGNQEGDDVSARMWTKARNLHPTVKPLSLMRWLCRLVTPPGGTILEPFAGSGTTCIAAALEGFKVLACEQSEEYVRIAEARLAHWTEQPSLGLVAG